MNLNPFKKKDYNDFKLNEHDLPTLGDLPGSENKSEGISEPKPSVPELPKLPDLGSSSEPTPSIPNLSSSPALTEAVEDTSTNELVGTAPNPIKSWDSPAEISSPAPSSSDDHHKTISNSKLDTIEAKVTLIDARIMAMEQKIELMFQMISNEVSDETKRKYKVSSMMKNIKN